MLSGLDILSAGLRFSATNVPGIAQAIEDLANRLARVPEAQELVELAKERAGERRFDAALLEDIDRARDAGAALATAIDWGTVQQEAWRELLQRCMVLHKKEQVQPAGLFELLCAARKTGPAAEIGLDLQAVPLAAWTRVLLGPMRAARASPPLPPSPPWLRAFALRRLGAARLLPPVLAELRRLFIPESEAKGEGEQQLVRDFLGTGGTAVRLGVLLGKKQGSVADRWVAPSDDGALLVAVERDWKDLLDLLLQYKGSRPLLVALEEPAERTDLKDTLDRISSTKNTLPLVHVYVQKMPDMQSPAIADPQGPGDVLAFHRQS